MPMQPLPPKVPPTLASNEDARESIVPVRARMRGSKLVGLIDNEGRDMGLPLTLSENSSGGVTNWDHREPSVAGAVIYSALPRLNNALPADGRTYSISAFPDLAKRIGRVSNGIGSFVSRSSVDNSWRSVCWSPELATAVIVGETGTANRVQTIYGCTYNPLTDFAVPKITAPAGCYAHIFAG